MELELRDLRSQVMDRLQAGNLLKLRLYGPGAARFDGGFVDASGIEVADFLAHRISLAGIGCGLLQDAAEGKEVTTLVNEQLQPGTYETEFDGTNLPSGVYFYKLEAGGFIETKKSVLLK